MKKMTKRNKFKETTTHKIRFVATKHREEFFLLSFIGMSKLLMAKRAVTELENASTQTHRNDEKYTESENQKEMNLS